MRIFPVPPLFRKSFRLKSGALLAGCLLIQAVSAQVREPTEFELKAALLYNFSLFTEWPIPSGSTFNLCLYGEDPFGPAINVLAQKSIQDRLLKVLYPHQLTDFNDCHIIYIYLSESKQLEQLMSLIHDKPILTVTDIPANNDHQGIINLAVEKQKIRFDIDLAAANRAGLSLSSKLLRLARHIYQ